MNQLLATRRETVSGTFSSRKQRDPSTDPAVQNMLGEISSSELLAAGHGGSSPKPSRGCQDKSLDHFLCRQAGSG